MRGKRSNSLAKIVKQSKSSKAGITFPVSRIHRYLRRGKYAKRIGIGGAVFQAVVMEYLAVEVLELAGNEAKETKKSLIKPRHIMFAIRKDEELNSFLKNVVISCGGVVPHIHATLLPRKR